MDAATLDDPAELELQRMTREDYVNELEQEGRPTVALKNASMSDLNSRAYREIP